MARSFSCGPVPKMMVFRGVLEVLQLFEIDFYVNNAKFAAFPLI